MNFENVNIEEIMDNNLEEVVEVMIKEGIEYEDFIQLTNTFNTFGTGVYENWIEENVETLAEAFAEEYNVEEFDETMFARLVTYLLCWYIKW